MKGGIQSIERAELVSPIFLPTPYLYNHKFPNEELSDLSRIL